MKKNHLISFELPKMTLEDGYFCTHIFAWYITKGYTSPHRHQNLNDIKPATLDGSCDQCIKGRDILFVVKEADSASAVYS